jgi:hypothetical protein
MTVDRDDPTDHLRMLPAREAPLDAQRRRNLKKLAARRFQRRVLARKAILLATGTVENLSLPVC